MSERTVREPNLALAQRLGRLEERVRAMSLRAWPGAIRTVGEPGPVVIEWVDFYETVLSVTLTAGRWVVLATASAYLYSASGIVDIRFVCTAADPSVGFGEPLTEGVDFPEWRYYATLAATTVVPVSTIGNLVADTVVTVALTTSNVTGEPALYYVYNPRLIAIPV